MEDTENNSQRPMVCQKRRYMQRLKNTNGQRRNRQVRRKNTRKERQHMQISWLLKRAKFS